MSKNQFTSQITLGRFRTLPTRCNIVSATIEGREIYTDFGWHPEGDNSPFIPKCKENIMILFYRDEAKGRTETIEQITKEYSPDTMVEVTINTRGRIIAQNGKVLQIKKSDLK